MNVTICFPTAASIQKAPMTENGRFDDLVSKLSKA